MKTTIQSALFAASMASLGLCQSAKIGFPTNGTTIVAGQNITIEIDRPDSLTGSTNLQIAIGLALCPDAATASASEAFPSGSDAPFSDPGITASGSASASAVTETFAGRRGLRRRVRSSARASESAASVPFSSFTAVPTATPTPDSGSSCFAPTEVMGTILFNGSFTPQFDTPADGLPPHQNFTVTIPADITGKAQLNLAHFALVGAGNFPLLDTDAVEVTVVPGSSTVDSATPTPIATASASDSAVPTDSASNTDSVSASV